MVFKKFHFTKNVNKTLTRAQILYTLYIPQFPAIEIVLINWLFRVKMRNRCAAVSFSNILDFFKSIGVHKYSDSEKKR